MIVPYEPIRFWLTILIDFFELVVSNEWADWVKNGLEQPSAQTHIIHSKSTQGLEFPLHHLNHTIHQEPHEGLRDLCRNLRDFPSLRYLFQKYHQNPTKTKNFINFCSNFEKWDPIKRNESNFLNYALLNACVKHIDQEYLLTRMEILVSVFEVTPF